MARVFISFVHEDERIADGLRRIIEDDLGLRGEVFIGSDPMQLLAGQDWLNRIREELSSAEVVLVMLSARSARRPWVNFEAGAAWLANKIVVPVCYGNMKVTTLPKPYSNWQGIDLPGDEQVLLLALSQHLNVRYQSPLLRSMIAKRKGPDYSAFEARPNLTSRLRDFSDDAIGT
jgi:hypothetical protein